MLFARSSTLENWCREFERFAPSITIETYYGGKNDRPYLREKLLRTQLGNDTRKGKSWEVLITTYNLAVGDALDKKFFRKIPWNVRCFSTFSSLNEVRTHEFISDLCLRRRTCPEELPVATIYDINSDRCRMEIAPDWYTLAE